MALNTAVKAHKQSQPSEYAHNNELLGKINMRKELANPASSTKDRQQSYRTNDLDNTQMLKENSVARP